MIDEHAPLEKGYSEEARRIIDALDAILHQGEELLRTLSADQYVRRAPEVFNASIGGHYRHCLDHFTSLGQGIDAGWMDYDHRERDPRIETDPAFALNITGQLRAQFKRISGCPLERTVRVRCEVNYVQGASPTTPSTVGREIVYAITHAIHHYALIAVMARLMNMKLPEHFGIAPSTVTHLADHSGR